jgi:hypothetical protein
MLVFQSAYKVFVVVALSAAACVRIPTISTVDSVSYRPQPKHSDTGYFINSQVDGISQGKA